MPTVFSAKVLGGVVVAQAIDLPEGATVTVIVDEEPAIAGLDEVVAEVTRGKAVDLVELMEAVHDRSSFLKFVSALAKDREEEVEIERVTSSSYASGANGWENCSIERFLEAAVAWAEDVTPSRFPESPSWGAFAKFLYLGKIYE